MSNINMLQISLWYGGYVLNIPAEIHTAAIATPCSDKEIHRRTAFARKNDGRQASEFRNVAGLMTICRACNSSIPTNVVHVDANTLNSYRSLTYGAVAAAVIFWCDYLFMLPTEIQRMWRRAFTGSTIIYFTMRYTLLIEQLFFLIGVLPSHYGRSACLAVNEVGKLLLFLNNITIAVLIIVRVSAICPRNWKVLLAIVPLALTPAVFSVTVTVLLDSDGVRTSFPNGPSPGCLDIFTWSGMIRETSNLSLVFYIFLFLSLFPLATLIGITWYKTLQIQKDLASTQCSARTPVSTLMIRNAQAWTFCFPVCVVLPHLMTNAVLTNFGSPHSLNVIIMSRFMLTLRPIYYAVQGSPDSEAVGTASKPAKAVGNLGATVDHDGAAHNEVVITDDPFRAGFKRGTRAQESLAAKSIS
ncbi:hypothetical protein C8Q80DRAFT_1118111 [Daedaleopsis nitida]|nr:hypothetical protein C8Q80DRAFT_1118111 [Daedaleopsis nitida]